MQSNAVTALPLSALLPRHPQHLFEKEGRNIAKLTLSLPTKFSQVLIELANPVPKESPQKKKPRIRSFFPPPLFPLRRKGGEIEWLGGRVMRPLSKSLPLLIFPIMSEGRAAFFFGNQICDNIG